MARLRSTPGRAVVRIGLTACARHSSEALAALEKVVLGLVDLWIMLVNVRPRLGASLAPCPRAVSSSAI